MIIIRPYPVPNEPVYHQDKLYYHQISNSTKKVPKKLLFAVGAAGGNPPGGNGDNIPNIFKNKYTKEQISKMNKCGKCNNILKKSFNSMMNHCKKLIKK